MALRFALFALTGFGSTVFRKLIKHDLSPCFVITNKESGPFPYYQERELFDEVCENNIPCSLGNAGEEHVKDLALDAIIVATYHRILKPELLAFVPLALNVHPSLLPLYRGPNPFYWAIADGRRETGVTIHQLNEKVDHGDIYWQKALPIQNDDTQGSLRKKLAELASEGVCELVRAANKTSLTSLANTLPEDPGRFWARRITNAERELNPNSFQKPFIRSVNALTPFPSATLDGREVIRILEVEPSPLVDKESTGIVDRERKLLLVQVRDARIKLETS